MPAAAGEETDAVLRHGILISQTRKEVGQARFKKLLRLFFQRAIDVGDGTLKELVEIRKPLEVQSAMLAAQRRTPQDLAQIKDVLAAMREHLDEPERYAELDITFHLHLASASRNQMLYHLIRSIRTLLQSVALRGLRNLRDIHENEYVQQLHEAITEAIERQDVDAARQAMDLHFETVVKTLFRTD